MHHQCCIQTSLLLILGLSHLSNGVYSGAVLEGEWYPKSQDGSQIPGRFFEPNAQEELCQRTSTQEEAQLNNLSTEGSLAIQSVANRTVETNNSSSAMRRSGSVPRERQYINQQRWLLFLIHARRCSAPEGKCPETNCIHAQKLLRHMEKCSKFDCRYLRCPETKVLINHYRQCKNVNCPVCIPVKKFMQTQQKVFGRPGCISDMTNSLNGTCRTYDAVETASKLTGNLSPVAIKTPEDLQPSLKRMKIEPSSQPHILETENFVPVSACESNVLQDAQLVEQNDALVMKAEVTEVKMEALANAVQVGPGSTDIAKNNSDDTYTQRPVSDSLASSTPGCLVKQENVIIETDIDQPKQENASAPSESTSGSKSGKSKIKAVSMMELFTPEQVQEHIKGLRQWIGQVSQIYSAHAILLHLGTLQFGCTINCHLNR